MKECRAPGLIGRCCKATEDCFMKFHAESLSEEDTLIPLRQSIDKITGCVCHQEIKEIVEQRIKNKESLL